MSCGLVYERQAGVIDLSVSPAAAFTANSYQASKSDNGWQQFAQLVSAVNAGDLSASQKAYATFTQSSAADVARASPNSRIAQALTLIGPALQDGDVGRAQQALASWGPKSRTPAAQPAANNSPNLSVPVNPNAPGSTLNLTV